VNVEPVKIVLIAGKLKIPDRLGHHDYLAGCKLLAALLEQSTGVQTIIIPNGWPEDERAFDGARAIVFYTGGGGKQAFLKSTQRLEHLQKLVDQHVGIVMIHQAVGVPREFAKQVTSWLGGAHVRGESQEGHWRSRHREFPVHPTTRGVLPWSIRDGWLNDIQFVDGLRGVTPLMWSGRKHRGSPTGEMADVVCWAYERPTGGRSFCFSGLDAHKAWAKIGVRQLLVNGALWAAGMPVPQSGAPCETEAKLLKANLTPRGGRGRWALNFIRRYIQRLIP
jgi:hypothetical protein